MKSKAKVNWKKRRRGLSKKISVTDPNTQKRVPRQN